MEENITLYPKKKEALTSKTAGGHIDKEYHIESDVALPSGLRTIVLQEKDLTEHKEKVSKLIDALLEKMGEGESKVMKKLLFDVLRDYNQRDIDRMYKRVVEGKAAVSVSDRCFHILIGDGRKRRHDEIVIRE